MSTRNVNGLFMRTDVKVVVKIVDPISILKKGSRSGSSDHGSKDLNALVMGHRC